MYCHVLFLFFLFFFFFKAWKSRKVEKFKVQSSFQVCVGPCFAFCISMAEKWYTRRGFWREVRSGLNDDNFKETYEGVRHILRVCGGGEVMRTLTRKKFERILKLFAFGGPENCGNKMTATEAWLTSVERVRNAHDECVEENDGFEALMCTYREKLRMPKMGNARIVKNVQSIVDASEKGGRTFCEIVEKIMKSRRNPAHVAITTYLRNVIEAVLYPTFLHAMKFDDFEGVDMSRRFAYVCDGNKMMEVTKKNSNVARQPRCYIVYSPDRLHAALLDSDYTLATWERRIVLHVKDQESNLRWVVVAHCDDVKGHVQLMPYSTYIHLLHNVCGSDASVPMINVGRGVYLRSLDSLIRLPDYRDVRNVLSELEERKHSRRGVVFYGKDQRGLVCAFRWFVHQVASHLRTSHLCGHFETLEEFARVFSARLLAHTQAYRNFVAGGKFIKQNVLMAAWRLRSRAGGNDKETFVALMYVFRTLAVDERNNLPEELWIKIFRQHLHMFMHIANRHIRGVV